jgi:glucan phosphoethanolaminetransferase (alkaline phosphatase superfamily)
LFLNILYFYDKLNKNDIKSPITLFIFAIFLANTLFFAILMFQKYQSFLVYSMIFLSFVFHFSIKLFFTHTFKEIKNLILLKEYNDVEKKDIVKNTLLYIGLYFITFFLSVISGSLLSAEYFAIFKRTGSITSSYVIDGVILKGSDRKIIKKKDILILLTILLTGLFLFFR